MMRFETSSSGTNTCSSGGCLRTNGDLRHEAAVQSKGGYVHQSNIARGILLALSQYKKRHSTTVITSLYSRPRVQFETTVGDLSGPDAPGTRADRCTFHLTKRQPPLIVIPVHPC
ncbi:hypothetical protein NEOLEDRAFT_1143869 [Neolentinus lepideus HHB14362 ss-1]|uniref:Uncharacterized protein n=1 Tax=Neolentinus lepideus HHB14362 ss-1 TaxID=1314782 RepID=A0A165M9H0_9AGAM|nr:hypothetical protein NEOLEDRAFT_1143869 [Neolentinus lepideus HHB14362 ss-1]